VKEQEITAICSLAAPIAQATEKSGFMDLIAVVDVSGSMAGAKIQLVSQTLLFLVSNLRSGDRFGLVTYQS